jgi:hypothetical protein
MDYMTISLVIAMLIGFLAFCGWFAAWITSLPFRLTSKVLIKEGRYLIERSEELQRKNGERY